MEAVKIIKDYENYSIDINGNVKNIKTGKTLKSILNSRGYYIVGLSKNGKRKNCKIHRLIALHFIDNPLNKECIDHIDRNRTNNNLNNLRWASMSQNQNNRTDQQNEFCGISHKIDRVKYHYWVAIIQKDNKTYSKQFPFSDEGKEKAREWHQSMRKELHTFL